MDLRQLPTLAHALHLPPPPPLSLLGFAIDSRKVQKGELFFALKGAKVDGHLFLEEVAKRGGVAAVVEKGYQGPHFGLHLLRVPDVEEALRNLAKMHLSQCRGKVIAISGSLGKTTTKVFAKQLLEKRYKVFATPHSYNSQVSLPLSILLIEGNEDFLLLEMAMSMPGQLRKLMDLAPPWIALLTKVALQHVTHFPEGLSGIAKEKISLFSHPKTELALYPYDLPHQEHLEKLCVAPRRKTYSSLHREADFYYPSPGLYPPFAENLVAAAALCYELGLTREEIQEGAASLTTPPMRFEKKEREGILFINDTFNANPDAFIMAISHLPSPQKGGRKIAAISEMDALGPFWEEEHRKVAEATLSHIDLLFCLGWRCEVMEKIRKTQGVHCQLFKSISELKQALFAEISPGDVVLLKGARGYALERLLEEEAC